MTDSVRRSSIVMDPTTRGRARVDSTAEPDVYANLASFSRHLRVENKAPSTIVTYSKAVEQLDSFLERDHRPRAVAELRREDLDSSSAPCVPSGSLDSLGRISRGEPAFPNATYLVGLFLVAISPSVSRLELGALA